jgi:hypothetical protein
MMPILSIPDPLNIEFESLEAASHAIKHFVIEQGESYKVTHADHSHYIIACRDSSYKFSI